MIFGGIINLTLSDFPSNPSTCLFTQGCNLRCIYCHNPQLIPIKPNIDLNIIKEINDINTNIITGIVITGGEPTIQPDLLNFLRDLKSRGLKIKIDTNGSRPRILESILKENLVDYVAMDIKAPLEKYSLITNTTTRTINIMKSIALLRNSYIEREFRTTIIHPYLNRNDIIDISNLVGDEKLILQRIRTDNTLNKDIRDSNIPTLEWMNETITMVGSNCILRI